MRAVFLYRCRSGQESYSFFPELFRAAALSPRIGAVPLQVGDEGVGRVAGAHKRPIVDEDRR